MLQSVNCSNKNQQGLHHDGRAMNILINNSTHDMFAGGEYYTLMLAKYLSKRGHAVCVSANPGHLLLKKCAGEGIETLPVVYGDMKKVFPISWQLREEIRRRSIDIIHSNANYGRTCSSFGARGTKAKHVATIHTAHSIQHNITHWWGNRFGTAHFIAVADAVRSVVMREDKIPDSKITVIPNGVEGDSPEFRAAARFRTRAAWNIPPGTIVIGNVARLVPFKGHKYLLRAIVEVVKDTREIFVPVLGDGELMDVLRADARDLGVDRYVRFFGFQDPINELIPAFDIYCHSSIDLAEEAFPIAIIQALAAGLPVVCTNVGGIRHMVMDGKNGYLVKPEDPRVLANGLLALIRDGQRRSDFGKTSLELFTREFHAERMAEKVEAVYHKVLAR